jgi:N-acetyl-anhydromuramyl-L-alanine amidase AmpD
MRETKQADDCGIECGVDTLDEDTSDDAPKVVAAQGAEYPKAEAFVASPYHEPRGARKVAQIIIHITDGSPKARNTARYFQNNPRKVSAHYVIGQGAEILQCVHHRNVAYHARGANYHTIGIEHSARVPRPGNPGFLPTPAQYRASAELVAWLCKQHGLSIDRSTIKGHCEVGTTTHHACPIGNLPRYPVWDWDGYMQLLQGLA